MPGKLIVRSWQKFTRSRHKPTVALKGHRCIIFQRYEKMFPCLKDMLLQATGLGAWASRVKCPAQFVSH